MSLDFHPCPKCGRFGLSWDARAKIIICLYHKCKYIIKNVEYAGKTPTEKEMTASIEKDKGAKP